MARALKNTWNTLQQSNFLKKVYLIRNIMNHWSDTAQNDKNLTRKNDIVKTEIINNPAQI